MFARLAAMMAKGMHTGGHPPARGGPHWACGCGFAFNCASRLTCYHCHLKQPHPAAKGSAARVATSAPSAKARSSSVAFATPTASPRGSPASPSPLASLESELVFNLECLKLAKAMPPSRLRDSRVSDLETEVARIRGEVRALRPLPQRLQAALAREAHQAGALKAAHLALADCALALEAAKATVGQATAEHAAAATELAEVQTALCGQPDDAMSVDQSAGQAATVVLGSYLADHAAQDPQLRDILATLGAAMGMSMVPWAGVMPPPVTPLSVPQGSEVAAAMAAALKQDRAATLASGGSIATRQKSNSRSPTPKGPAGTGKGKSNGGKGGPGHVVASGAGPAPTEGLAQLQAVLGLSAAGLPVPDCEDDV